MRPRPPVAMLERERDRGETMSTRAPSRRTRRAVETARYPARRWRRRAPSTARVDEEGGAFQTGFSSASMCRRTLTRSADGATSRVSRQSSGSSVCVEMPTSAREAGRDAGEDVRVLEVRRRFDDRLARSSGSPDLKMPEPTKTPSAPSCNAERCVGRVLRSACGERTTAACRSGGPSARARTALQLLRLAYSSSSASEVSLRYDRTERIC